MSILSNLLNSFATTIKANSLGGGGGGLSAKEQTLPSSTNELFSETEIYAWLSILLFVGAVIFVLWLLRFISATFANLCWSFVKFFLFFVIARFLEGLVPKLSTLVSLTPLLSILKHYTGLDLNALFHT